MQHGNPFVLLEFFEGGSLRDAFEAKNEIFVCWPEPLCSILADIVAGMRYLHEHGVVHRDLKPGNVLLDLTARAAVADFGESRIMEQMTVSENSRGLTAASEDDNFMMTVRHAGTLVYQAPEITRDGHYNTKADVYSFALILWEAWTREHPWSHVKRSWDLRDAVVRGERPHLPETMPTLFGQLVTRCWAQSAAERPAFADIDIPSLSDSIASAVQ